MIVYVITVCELLLLPMIGLTAQTQGIVECLAI